VENGHGVVERRKVWAAVCCSITWYRSTHDYPKSRINQFGGCRISHLPIRLLRLEFTAVHPTKMARCIANVLFEGGDTRAIDPSSRPFKLSCPWNERMGHTPDGHSDSAE